MERRTKMFGASLIALTALALSGCGTGAASGDQSEKALTWAMWIGGTEDQAAWQGVADTVAVENDGLKLTIQGAPFGDYWTKLRTQLGTGSAPCIVSLQSLRAASYADALLPLDDLVKSEDVDLSGFDETALNGMRVDGDLYALPYDTGPVVMFYNKDLFAQHGVAEPAAGWSVEDFESSAKAFADAGVTFFQPTAEDMYLESLILGYNGGRVVGENGDLDATDPAFSRGLDWIGSLVTRGYAAPASSDAAADETAFLAGSIATYIDGPWSLITQRKTATFDVGAVTIPHGNSDQSTFSAGSGFGISKSCKYPKQAFAAIQTMTSTDVLQTLGDAGRAFPSRTDAQASWLEATGIEGIEDVFRVAQDTSTPLPGTANGDQLSQLFAQYTIGALNGEQTGADVMSQIASQLPK